MSERTSHYNVPLRVNCEYEISSILSCVNFKLRMEKVTALTSDATLRLDFIRMWNNGRSVNCVPILHRTPSATPYPLPGWESNLRYDPCIIKTLSMLLFNLPMNYLFIAHDFRFTIFQFRFLVACAAGCCCCCCPSSQRKRNQFNVCRQSKSIRNGFQANLIFLSDCVTKAYPDFSINIFFVCATLAERTHCEK